MLTQCSKNFGVLLEAYLSWCVDNEVSSKNEGDDNAHKKKQRTSDMHQEESSLCEKHPELSR